MVPVASVHSYADISPVVTAQYVRDCDAEQYEQQAVINSQSYRTTTTPPLTKATSPTAAKGGKGGLSFREPPAATASGRPISAPSSRPLPRTLERSPYLKPTAPPLNAPNPYRHTGMAAQGKLLGFLGGGGEVGLLGF